MKKIVATILVAVMMLALMACGQKKENKTVTQLDVGGGTIDLGGTYEIVDAPSWFTTDGNKTYEFYYNADYDASWVIVITTPKGTETFEDIVKNDAEAWGDGYYQIEGTLAYYAGIEKTPDMVYYAENNMMELEDSIKTILFLYKTEEVSLCDSGLYMYLPTGYTNIADEAMKLFGCDIEASYDGNPYFPNVVICKDLDTYEKVKSYFSYIFGHFDISEEQYNAWTEWSDEDIQAFYKAVGYEYVFGNQEETQGFSAYTYGVSGETTDSKYETFTYVEYSGNWYLINAYTKLTNPVPTYATALVKSIHTK